MSLLDLLLNKGSKKYFGPKFLKESGDSEEFIQKMKGLSQRVDGELKDTLNKQIAKAEKGLLGENRIAYALKNSGMDMLVLHDVYLEKNGLSAQIDFLVMTRKHTFSIECKNIYGDIAIDEKGNFFRRANGRIEAIESPVTQNERHLNLLKEIRRDRQRNDRNLALFEKMFPKYYRSIIALANPSTIVRAKKAPQAIQDIVMRVDRLVSYIKELEEKDDVVSSSEFELNELMDSILACRTTNPENPYKKYAAKVEEFILNKQQQIENVKNTPLCPLCGNPLVLRTSKYGAYAGKHFLGCKAFPKCHFTKF